MSSELAGQVALVTGGGRGIGRSIALELTEAGATVAVSSRTRAEVEATAGEIGGLAIEADMSRREDVEQMVVLTEAELGPIDLLVANAGVMISEPDGGWAVETDSWWHVFEVNVLGVYLANRTVIPGMIDRGHGRIVNVASGAAYLPGAPGSAYGGSKAAVHRMSEALAAQLKPHGIPVFSISPGLVRTAMTEAVFSEDAPWTPPEYAPRLVRRLASGRLDALTGRYLHAEHDDLDDLERRADEIVENDLNAIRLRR
jgi:NAD(P)-dependent dehydrogenase (short-subunit alcohol dehydrogenase family)